MPPVSLLGLNRGSLLAKGRAWSLGTCRALGRGYLGLLNLSKDFFPVLVELNVALGIGF